MPSEVPEATDYTLTGVQKPYCSLDITNTLSTSIKAENFKYANTCPEKVVNDELRVPFSICHSKRKQN